MLHPHRQGITLVPVSKWEICTSEKCRLRTHILFLIAVLSLGTLLSPPPITLPHHSLLLEFIAPSIVQSWTADALRLVQIYLNCSSQSRSCSQTEMCECSPHDLSPVSQQVWQGREPAHRLWAHKLPLWNAESKAQNKQICWRNPDLKGYSHCFHPYVLPKPCNSITVSWK